LAEVAQCDDTVVDGAVAAASKAQQRWASLAPADRAAALWRWSELIRTHAPDLATMDMKCIGQPHELAHENAVGASRSAQYWAGMCDKIGGRELPLVPDHLSYTRREPIGVVGVILPWNAPMAGFVGRSAASLACGNAVVVKPSEYSPTSALRLAELSVQAGLPRGAINVVTGNGTVGQAMTTHPRIGAITFTGSIATGRSISVASAPSFKKLTLEMGGKSPNIIFSDCDLDLAARGAAFAVFHNSGQVCCGGTRLLVQREVVDQFTEEFVRVTDGVRVGHPLEHGVHLGPLVSRTQFDRVNDYIEVGRTEGAVLASGGGRPKEFDRGFYIAPTIFTDVESQMRIAQEEIFGPVVVIIPFDDEQEALRLAADVEYGLAAMVWTNDVSRMIRMANDLEVGMVWGNTTLVVHPGLPFGGFRNSGLGNAFGLEAMEGLTRVKRVSIRSGATFRLWPDV
jgi:acyl-CoA reductase-like NAD-dependent aldehyde dehydrogenase